MDALEWCRSRVAPRGSDLALILSFVDPSKSDRVVAFQALRQELQQIPVRVSDPDVARSKLAWWRGAIGEFIQGQGEHPVLKALHPWHGRFSDSSELFDQWLGALFSSLAAETLQQWEDAQQALIDQLRPALQLELQLFDQSLDDQALAAMAISEGLTTILCQIRRDQPNASAALPYRELASHGLTRGDLCAPNPGPKVHSFFKQQIQRIDGAAQLLKSQVPAKQQDALRHIFLRQALDRQLMKRTRIKGPKTLSQMPAIPGYQKLWCVWREGGRLRRQALNQG